MAWAQPYYNKGELDGAGRFLAAGRFNAVADVDDALEVLNNWRSSHAFPLNTFQVTLRKKARKVYESALVAQRIKRVPSIMAKLRRFPTMHLSQMQDIGGCRAVVDTAAQASRLKTSYLGSDLKHELIRQKDYIQEPKDSGYRGVHLIYRYRSDKSSTYNGLQIEMQLRSRIQHAWATAVETVGTFLEQSLKSSEGPEQWLQFFTLTSSAFALLEKTPTVQNTPTRAKELRAAISELAQQLQVRSKLGAYGAMLDITQDEEHEESQFFLLELNPGARTLNVRSYRIGELQKATADYLEIEKQFANIVAAQAVLVSAGSLDALRRAYPNYYLDTEVFLRYLERVIRGRRL